MSEQTMRAVVQQIRRNKSEARLELLEMTIAIHQIRETLTRVINSRETLPTESNRENLLLDQLQPIRRALEEYCRGIDGWNISEPDTSD